MASSSRQSAFQRSLEQYLARQDIEDFETTTLKDLKRDISKLQPTQPQDLKRLKYFLEGIEQYGKVVKRYDSNTDLVAFIWGPLKFLLQATRGVDGAFRGLLGVYEEIGDNFPFLVQFQGLFRAQPHLVQVLSLLYEDILKFQAVLLRFFRNPEWKRNFDVVWDTIKYRLSGIILNVAQRRTLIESETEKLSRDRAFRR